MKVMAAWEREREEVRVLGTRVVPPAEQADDHMAQRRHGQPDLAASVAAPSLMTKLMLRSDKESAEKTKFVYPVVPLDVAYLENFGRALVLSPKAQFLDIVIDGVVLPMLVLRKIAMYANQDLKFLTVDLDRHHVEPRD